MPTTAVKTGWTISLATRRAVIKLGRDGEADKLLEIMQLAQRENSLIRGSKWVKPKADSISLKAYGNKEAG